MNLNNYKGLPYDVNKEQKYQDKVTGAHFNYKKMVERLKQLQRQLNKELTKFEKLIQSKDVHNIHIVKSETFVSCNKKSNLSKQSALITSSEHCIKGYKRAKSIIGLHKKSINM